MDVSFLVTSYSINLLFMNELQYLESSKTESELNWIEVDQDRFVIYIQCTHDSTSILQTILVFYLTYGFSMNKPETFTNFEKG